MTPSWAERLLQNAEEVTDAAVETMLVCRPDRWADAPYQYLADQSKVEFHYTMEYGGKDLVVSQRTDALKGLGVTGAVVWDGAVVLARCMEWWARDDDSGCGIGMPVRGMNIIELGAGCGLTGLVLSFMGAKVTLTDQEERLSLLKHNLSLNFPQPTLDHRDQKDNVGNKKNRKGGTKEKEKSKFVSKSDDSRRNRSPNDKGYAEVRELDWESEDLSSFQPLDLVIATDCVFNELVVPPFVNVLHKLCEIEESLLNASEVSESKIPVLNCMEIRCAEVHEVFLEEALVHFQVFRLNTSLSHSTCEHPRIVIYLFLLR